MYTIQDFLSNYPLMCAITGWIAAQICKICLGLFKKRRFDIITAFFGTGGMPSSHSTTVSALALACGIKYGLNSFEFAISVILAFIVMRDAVGVRRSAGEQAKMVNHLCTTLSSNGIGPFKSDLKELIGHTPLQVVAGAILGGTIPFIMMLIIPES